MMENKNKNHSADLSPRRQSDGCVGRIVNQRQHLTKNIIQFHVDHVGNNSINHTIQ